MVMNRTRRIILRARFDVVITYAVLHYYRFSFLLHDKESYVGVIMNVY